MSAPVSYVLRPAKNMERKMICEASARLAMIAPLHKYAYVGFGGLTFQDFGMFHHRLGVRDMISIEKRTSDRHRFEFNRPFSCIKMQWGISYDVLPLLSWKKPTIIWLDYEVHPNSEVLQDISLVASRIRSGSLLVVTVAADPGGGSDPSAQRDRMATLIARVGKARVPVDLKPEHLAKWGTARTYKRIISDVIETTINDRNAALATSERVAYRQIFNFHYQDGSKMLTVGGIIVNPDDAQRLGPDDFRDLRFVRTGEDEYAIRFPILTGKETRHLDARLPTGRLRRAPAWLPDEDRQSYRDLYRYFPNFVEAEI